MNLLITRTIVVTSVLLFSFVLTAQEQKSPSEACGAKVINVAVERARATFSWFAEGNGTPVVSDFRVGTSDYAVGDARKVEYEVSVFYHGKIKKASKPFDSDMIATVTLAPDASCEKIEVINYRQIPLQSLKR